MAPHQVRRHGRFEQTDRRKTRRIASHVAAMAAGPACRSHRVACVHGSPAANDAGYVTGSCRLSGAPGTAQASQERLRGLTLRAHGVTSARRTACGAVCCSHVEFAIWTGENGGRSIYFSSPFSARSPPSFQAIFPRDTVTAGPPVQEKPSNTL